MERQQQSSHDAYDVTDAAVAGFFKLGVDKERKEAKEVKPAEISPPGEGGEEQKAQSEPEQGAAAEEKEAGDEGEGKEGCDVSVGAAGPADGESREAEAEAGSGEGGEQGGEEQPPRAAVEGPEAADGQWRAPHARLTQVQVQDLERVFQHTQYPSALVRPARDPVQETQLGAEGWSGLAGAQPPCLDPVPGDIHWDQAAVSRRAGEVKPAEISPPGEGGEEQKAQSEPEQGAAAEEKEAGDEGEGKEGCDVSVGAAGPADGESREAEAEAGSGEGGEQGGEEQPPRAAVEGPEAADWQWRAPRARFTQVQVQDLERVFQHTQYPSALVRQELTRCMGVTEDKVKAWFKSRRAKWRRNQRALMLSHMAPVPPVVISLCEPCSSVSFRELKLMCDLLEPLLMDLSLLPRPPRPPVQPVRPVPPVRPTLPEDPMPPMQPMAPMPTVPPVPPMQLMWPMHPVPPVQPMLPMPPEPPLWPGPVQDCEAGVARKSPEWVLKKKGTPGVRARKSDLPLKPCPRQRAASSGTARGPEACELCHPARALASDARGALTCRIVDHRSSLES
ncbi:PREDICTED: homeobox protein ESX1-like [Lipotes vexillifer]|uniref:Homeobox protein ESX1-like n=1 Tax=Lipotes vexillifer TaxID=118797 RepID=A0A340XHM9_LIPVE|nr:PREDICTED: homeobox protein ESX1-like [Lipotes vexillifer]